MIMLEEDLDAEMPLSAQEKVVPNGRARCYFEMMDGCLNPLLEGVKVIEGISEAVRLRWVIIEYVAGGDYLLGFTELLDAGFDVREIKEACAKWGVYYPGP